MDLKNRPAINLGIVTVFLTLMALLSRNKKSPPQPAQKQTPWTGVILWENPEEYN